MELSEFIAILRQYKRFIAAVILLALGASVAVSVIRVQTTEASFSLIIRPKVIESTQNFEFTDVLEASDRMTRMTENWMNAQQRALATRRLGNQVITISFNSHNEEAARAQMSDILTRSNTLLASLSPTPGLGAFEALVSDFSFHPRNPYWLFSLSIGFFAGLVVALFGALFRHYLA